MMGHTCHKILIYLYPVGFCCSKQHDNPPDGCGHSTSAPGWNNN